MEKRRLRTPSPAFVVSLIALFVAVGGTGYAAIALAPNSVGTSQLKNGAVTKRKINKKTIAALKGRRGPKGATGNAGANGTAVAYARVLANGTVDATQAKGITSANVSHPGAGIYCFSGLSFTPHNVVGSPQHTFTTLSTFINKGLVYASCPGTSQISVVVGDSATSTAQDGPFMIEIN